MQTLIIGGAVLVALLSIYAFNKSKNYNSVKDRKAQDEPAQTSAKENSLPPDEYTQEGMCEAIVSFVTDRAQRGYAAAERSEPLIFGKDKYDIRTMSYKLSTDSKHKLLREYSIYVVFLLPPDRPKATIALRW